MNCPEQARPTTMLGSQNRYHETHSSTVGSTVQNRAVPKDSRWWVVPGPRICEISHSTYCAKSLYCFALWMCLSKISPRHVMISGGKMAPIVAITLEQKRRLHDG